MKTEKESIVAARCAALIGRVVEVRLRGRSQPFVGELRGVTRTGLGYLVEVRTGIDGLDHAREVFSTRAVRELRAVR